MPLEREREISSSLTFTSTAPTSSPTYKSISLHLLRLHPLLFIRAVAESDLVIHTDESPASIPASLTSKSKADKAALFLKRDWEHIWHHRLEFGDATVLSSCGVDFSNEATWFRKEFDDVERDF